MAPERADGSMMAVIGGHEISACSGEYADTCCS
jgi:hypothetical protein